MTRSSETGLPVVSVGRIVTTEDVRALEDDDLCSLTDCLAESP